MSQSENQLTRRNILTGAGAGAAAAAFGAVAFSASTAQARGKWDHEADIVCIGGGVAAMTAAAIARGEGSSVILLEKGPVVGGTTAKSAGVYWIPNHFALKKQGIDDSKEDCMKYICRFSYPERYTPDSPTLGLEPAAYEQLEAFYDNGSDAVDRLGELGALKSVQWTSWSLKDLSPDYFGHAPENKVPEGRPLAPLTAEGAEGGGTDVIGQLEDSLTASGVPILTDHKVVRIVTNKKGETIGVEAEADGKTVTIRGRKAVIFGTGGYSQNPEFVRLYQRNHSYGACASGLSTGDFINIAGAAGARLGNMSGGWRAQVLLEQALKNPQLTACVFMPPGDSMIEVNKYGKRAVNENRNYNDRTEAHFVYDPTHAEFPNHLMFMICDQRTAEGWAGNYPLPKPGETSPYIIKGDSLAELAENLQARLETIAAHTGGVKLDKDFTENLEATVARFNEMAAKGVDEDFGRGGQEYDRVWPGIMAPKLADTDWPENENPSPFMHPLREEGPYYAAILGAGMLDTNGGPVINAKAQIIGTSGDPIPGLYGAGNCIASPTREAYFGSGGTIGPALTYGYIAGKNAHNEPVKKT